MYAMQYAIPLPSDYAMAIIRDRVARNGHRLDGFPGLGLKAYLIRERGAHEATVNDYAPFYLWADTAGMADFLWGGAGFGGIVASFGRPAVRHWAGATVRRGPAYERVGAFARRQTVALAADSDPQAAVTNAIAAAARLAERPGVVVTACAVDPLAWEVMTFALTETADAVETGTLYQVLHVSRPELDHIVQA